MKQAAMETGLDRKNCLTIAEHRGDSSRRTGSAIEVVRNLGTGNLPAELESFIVQRPEYDYAHHIRTGTEQERYVPDEMVDPLCIVGTPDRCVERVCELADLGVTHINFYAQTDNFEQQMEIWGQDIIPRT
jgi:hypothetical protein